MTEINTTTEINNQSDIIPTCPICYDDLDAIAHHKFGNCSHTICDGCASTMNAQPDYQKVFVRDLGLYVMKCPVCRAPDKPTYNQLETALRNRVNAPAPRVAVAPRQYNARANAVIANLPIPVLTPTPAPASVFVEGRARTQQDYETARSEGFIFVEDLRTDAEREAYARHRAQVEARNRRQEELRAHRQAEAEARALVRDPLVRDLSGRTEEQYFALTGNSDMDGVRDTERDANGYATAIITANGHVRRTHGRPVVWLNREGNNIADMTTGPRTNGRGTPARRICYNGERCRGHRARTDRRCQSGCRAFICHTCQTCNEGWCQLINA